MCGCDDGSRTSRVEATGLPYELVLIVSDDVYQGEVRDSLLAMLEGSTPILPQHEPMFRLSVIPQPMREYKLFRSRLIVDIDPSASAPSIGQASNVVAYPQMELRVTAPDAHSLATFIGQQSELITDLFVDHELQAEATRLRQHHTQWVTDSLQHRFGHTVYVPEGFRASKVGQDFFWAGTNLNDKDQNYVHYSYPWDGSPLNEAAFVAKRDSVMRANIPGSREGQYMETSRVPLTSQEGAGEGRPLVLVRARIINKVHPTFRVMRQSYK